jgi:hypothetical protein
MNQIRPSWHEKLEKTVYEFFSVADPGMNTPNSDCDFSIPDLESRIRGKKALGPESATMN